MTKKNKKAKSAARKASAASKSDFKEVPRTRRRSLAIAAAIIAIVILAVWGIKSFADGERCRKGGPAANQHPEHVTRRFIQVIRLVLRQGWHLEPQRDFHRHG